MNFGVWTITVLALLGTGVCIYTALDAQADLRSRKGAGLNGRLEVAGKIARRSAASSGIMHLTWLLIGVLVVVPQFGWLARLLGPIGLTAAIILMQIAAILAQFQTQLDRRRARS